MSVSICVCMCVYVCMYVCVCGGGGGGVVSGRGVQVVTVEGSLKPGAM